MRRREFIALIVGTTVGWPFAACAQDATRTRNVGMLIGIGRDDPDAQLRYAAFLEELRKLGWTDGQNVRVDVRWAGGDADLIHQYAAQLISLTPDVTVTVGSLASGLRLRPVR